MDEVTFFYVVDLFCMHLRTKYANFQEKISAEISGKKTPKLFIVDNFWTTLYVRNDGLYLVRVTSQNILTVFYFQGNFMTLS